jgi:two-component SAPR family response regulator
MRLTCVALDDEPLALQIIAQYCGSIDFINLQKVFTNPDEAKIYIEQNQVDILFLDIQMPDINGIQFYKSLSKKPVIKLAGQSLVGVGLGSKIVQFVFLYS